MMINLRIITSLVLGQLLSLAATAAECAEGKRCVLSLDGTWQIAEGGNDAAPAKFERNVPVPGLVDLATPPFVAPGPRVADGGLLPPKDPRRDAFWYRRTFQLTGQVPEVARLKIGKATFGTRVFLNGKLLGDHAPCFTPGWFDARDALKTGANELLVRVGADPAAVAGRAHWPRDGEKTRYIPGIFDSVELILSSRPAIDKVQVAPDLANRQARVRVWLKSAGDVTLEVRETESGKRVGQASGAAQPTVDLTVPIADCRL